MVLLLPYVMAYARPSVFFSHFFSNLKTHNLMIYRRLPGADEHNNTHIHAQVNRNASCVSVGRVNIIKRTML